MVAKIVVVNLDGDGFELALVMFCYVCTKLHYQ